MKLRSSRVRAGLIGAAVVACVIWWVLHGLFAPAGSGGPIRVQIPEGSSAGQISEILARAGAVRSAFGFRVAACLVGKSTDLKPGAYALSPAMRPWAIADKMARGDVCAKWVTFPEGYTIRQIAKRIEAEGLGRADRFTAYALRYGGSFSTAFRRPGDSLEGYLFPDTYLIPIGGTERAIIQTMLDTFELKVAGPLAAEVIRSGMKLHDVVTLASMIEREARVGGDRALVSAVLYNRLARGMRLECDATVLYALGRHKNRVLYADLAADSAYNTYKCPGLPPGPIANPGLASIRAALHPAPVDYLYYVAQPGGSHVFSRTLAEHQRATLVARGKAAKRRAPNH